jgi:phage terminase large subunit-like protein
VAESKQPASRRRKTGSISSKTPADYVSVAIAYAEDAVEDRKGKRFGKWIRLAARRFLKDLRRTQSKKPPFYWSPGEANRACAFIEELPHVEGTWSSATIHLEPAQVFFVAQLFGFRNQAGGRRFTTALFAIARKNAKSTLAAGILLYVMCCEPETGPQIFAAATTGDQARIVWSVAKRMVERTADLREAFLLEPFANAIARYENGGTFKAINAKASTQDGLNPSALCFDELHAHKTHDLLNVLTSAAGARANPLFLYTTTEGYETPGPWPETREFAKQILQNVLQAEHFLAIYYAVDEKDDDFDESVWIKANPLIESNLVLAAAIRKEAIEAKAMAGRLAEFRIKRLNRQASAAQVWVNLTKWKRCAGPVDINAMVGAPCWAGFDLASTTDMTAWRLLWLLEGRWYTWGRYWVPEEAVKQRTVRGTVPYAAWIAAGHITQTDGEVTDYVRVEREILEDCARFAPIEIGYDSWNAVQLANNLKESGQPVIPFIQGPKSYQPAMSAFEREYSRGNLNHGGNPVLTWNAANLVPRRDANMNMAPDRKRSAEKIDGMVALLMAFGRAELGVKPYDFQELTVV